MTAQEHEARISRAMVCMENATDPQDQRHWWEELERSIRARNADRTPIQLRQLEESRGLR